MSPNGIDCSIPLFLSLPLSGRQQAAGSSRQQAAGSRQQDSHKENPFLHVFGQASCSGLLVKSLAVVDDVEVAVQPTQVTLSIMVQVRAGAHPDVAPPASSKVVQDDAGYLAPLAHSCSITNEEASTCM